MDEYRMARKVLILTKRYIVKQVEFISHQLALELYLPDDVYTN